MKIIVTAKEAIDKWVWHQICDIKGWDEYCVADGKMDSSEEIELTEEQAKKLGILK